MVLYMLFGKKAKSYAFYVDNARVNEIKASTNKDGVDFVSTNDILTASFANLIGARICMMAVNFRSRLRSFDTYDAGNYEGALLYDSTSYSTPSHIRKTLSKGPPFETRGEQMPGFFEGSLSRISMVSNWATFAKDLKVEACDQELHIPAGKLQVPVPNPETLQGHKALVCDQKTEPKQLFSWGGCASYSGIKL